MGKKKALIFGVTGQDGAYLSKYLLKKGSDKDFPDITLRN